LAHRRLMAQLLQGQLDRLACAKYGMCETPSLPKIFKAGLGIVRLCLVSKACLGASNADPMV
jgi:hypothetical protein